MGLPKKVFLCLIFNVVFNIVKINFSSKFLHGTTYSTADFSPREVQTNRSVTVKVLSLLDAKQLRHTEKLNSLLDETYNLRPSGFQALCQKRKFIQIAE